MKKSFYHRVGDFIEGKGFYIVLALCIAAIGLSGWFLISSLRGPEQSQPAGGTASITVTPAPQATDRIVPVKPTLTPSPTPAATVPAAGLATDKPVATPTPTATPSSAPTSLTWPVRGEVLTGYTVEALAYDVTMGDWRTHSGLDIAAAVGSEVRAPAAGVVLEVRQDAMLGTTVVMDHGGGLTTVCANLAATPTVQEGDSVLLGDVIGSVGDTAIAESALASHLHFSVLRDGESVDPMELLEE